ncbi:surface-adhesin E family protein [Undibacterium sp. Ji83W]|uniref:surface-adhesin E family protein n=1 Tax=Undibacterium sp. Ji83W TaxID=3413043 RepID=UPI003BF2231A
MSKFMIFIFLLFPIYSLAQSNVYLCTNKNGKKEYKNTDQTGVDFAICKRVDLNGIDNGKKELPIGSDWVEVLPDVAKRYSEYFNKKSLTENGSARKVWVLTSFYDLKNENGISYKSTKRLQIYKCKQNEVGNVQRIAYTGNMGSGDVVASDVIPINKIQYIEVVPESMGEGVLREICAYKK